MNPNSSGDPNAGEEAIPGAEEKESMLGSFLCTVGVADLRDLDCLDDLSRILDMDGLGGTVEMVVELLPRCEVRVVELV